MSSHDGDVDISVVSSPESSPHHVRDESPIRMENRYHHTTNFHHSNESRLSSPKTSPEQGKTTGGGTGYTSFSISSILSRNEPKKGPLIPLPTLPQPGVGGPQDAAMLTR